MSEIDEETIARAIWDSKLLQPAKGPWDGTNSAAMQCCCDAARAVLALVLPAIERARVEERERCAKVADEIALRQPNSMFYTAKEEGMASAAQFIAAAIRKG